MYYILKTTGVFIYLFIYFPRKPYNWTVLFCNRLALLDCKGLYNSYFHFYIDGYYFNFNRRDAVSAETNPPSMGNVAVIASSEPAIRLHRVPL